MSAIAGIVHEGGRPAGTAAVKGMLQALAHRAPDGQTSWNAGRAALGHGLLNVVDEPPEDAQPLTESGLTIVADVRIDNREELIADLAPREKSLSDARLILHAYRRWGEGAPERLLGDFAFAIWDAGRKVLFAARDHAGVKPFYYHQDPTRFVFASEVKGVLAAGGVPLAINEARIAEFLAAVPQDTHQTLYASVSRLPPGHSLRLAGGQVAISSYWTLPNEPAIARKDAPEACLEIFTRAVTARMRGNSPVGAMLSGGLDSSSVAKVAAPVSRHMHGRPLTTLSLVFDQTPQWSERPFIESVLQEGDFDPVFLDCDGYPPMRSLDRHLHEQDGLFVAPSLDLTSDLYSAAAKRGLKVMLNGHGGDEVVSQGYGRLPELADAGRWGTLWRELRGVMRTYNTPSLPLFMEYFELQGPLKHVYAKARRLKARFSRPGPAVRPKPGWALIVNADLAKRTGIAATRSAVLRPSDSARNQHDYHRATTEPRMQSYALEILDHAAAGAGIEVRYPFWDKRFLEFCLSLESQEILDGGWPRLVLRRAMEGVLPKKVQWRSDKLDFTPHVVRGMLSHHREMLDAIILRDEDDIGAFVDLEGAAGAWGRIVSQREAVSGYDVQFVWRTATFAHWLRRERQLPLGPQIA